MPSRVVANSAPGAARLEPEKGEKAIVSPTAVKAAVEARVRRQGVMAETSGDVTPPASAPFMPYDGSTAGQKAGSFAAYGESAKWEIALLALDAPSLRKRG